MTVEEAVIKAQSCKIRHPEMTEGAWITKCPICGIWRNNKGDLFTDKEFWEEVNSSFVGINLTDNWEEYVD